MPDHKGANIQAKHERYQCAPREVGKPQRNAWKEFGAELRLLNIAAVESRYPNSDGKLPGKLDENCYVHREITAPRLIAFHKALGCFMYQCSEGSIPDSELYKIMDNTHIRSAFEIIHELPEYSAAEWG
jgi:hypothetical protein